MFEDAIILVDKPLNWTSFDVVKKVKGLTKVKKIGHAGTLDPLATGLLILATGKKTKEIESVQAGRKEYLAEIVLGATSASDDAEFAPGFLSEEVELPELTTSQIEAEIKANFLGEITQLPPNFSAAKSKNGQGKRGYHLARKGLQPELRSKLVQVDEFQIFKLEKIKLKDLNWPLTKPISEAIFEKPVYKFAARIVCGKGTYIRSLARDLGKNLGCGGFMLNLQRTKIADYKLTEALTIDQISKLIVN